MLPLNPQPPDWTNLPATQHWVSKGRFYAQIGTSYRFSLSAPSEQYTSVLLQNAIWYWIIKE